MKRITFVFLGVFLFSFIFINSINAQVLPSDRRVNWSQVLTNFVFNYPTNAINFVSAGGNNTGSISNDALMTSILNGIDSSTGAIIYFPQGTYLFNSTIDLKSNVILKGESAGNTVMNFDLGGTGNLIQIYGTQTLNESNFALPASKDEDIITVNDASSFHEGDFIRIIDNDIAKVTSDWALGTTGQISKIKSIAANQITLSSSLRRAYNLGDVPKIVKLTPVTNVGIDNISINRVDATTSQTSNIDVFNAANCLFNCIQSVNCNFSHISIAYSTNCQVVGSYFKDAFDYGDGGKGYGVVLKSATGECLITNNIFIHLRHSMLLQSGANGNVLSYNYSSDPYWTEPSLPSNSAGDLVLHGNWPYCNLMEGNIVQNIIIDNSHGFNGPFNTFHRNRAELYGVFMNDSSGDFMNFSSNEVINTGLFMGLYYITGSNHFHYGNNIKGTIYDTGTTGATENYMYLPSLLPYYNSNSFWPPIGVIENYNTNSIESKVRYSTHLLTQCSSLGIATENLIKGNNELTIFPNPTNSILTINGLLAGDEITIFNALGKVQSKFNPLSETFSINTENLPIGVYLCCISSTNNKKTNLRFVKMK